MIVYKLTNTTNGKFYIGKTAKSTKWRMSMHRQKANAGVKTYLYYAMRKYGIDKFVIEPIDTSATTENQLNLLEQKYIAELSPPYNMTKGGDGGDTSKSPNYQKYLKRRPSMKGKNNFNYGRRGPLSPKFGKTYGPKPNISKAKKEPVMANGVRFDSVGEAEQALKIKWTYSSKVRPYLYYKI
jgi:group I intron endonuclease